MNRLTKPVLSKLSFRSFSQVRIETDSFGPIEVPAHKYWAAQTQRSIQNFAIGTEEDKMPEAVVKAMGIVKKSAALANMSFDLDAKVGNAIVNASNEVISGKLIDNFPLVVFQTGSGTQTNMNTNEVIANRACELLGGKKGDKKLVHPNDDVNRAASSNDTFPTAMNIAVTVETVNILLPSLQALHQNIDFQSKRFNKIIKIGRTHCQDATPLTLGQEFSGYATQIKNHIKHVENNLEFLTALAQGGTAVGTGLNTKKGFAEKFAEKVAEETNIAFKSADNKFEALATHDGLAHFSGTLNSLATSLFKVASDIKLLSTVLPELKVKNLSPIEESLQSAVQAIGNNIAVTIGNMQGHFELNVYKPLIVSNILNSIYLLSSSAVHLNDAIKEIEANTEEITKLMNNSLMLVTALNPYIGYDKAATLAKHAHKKGTTLKEAALELGYLTEKQFNEYVRPELMISPSE